MADKFSQLELGVFIGEVRQALIDIKRRGDEMSIKLDAVDDKVTHLEKFKMKVVGMVIGVSAVTSIFGSVIGFFLQRLL